MSDVLIRSDGTVTYRPDGRILGSVLRVPVDSGRSDAGTWVAYSVLSDDGLPEVWAHRRDAALSLLLPSNQRPSYDIFCCRACSNTFPRPEVCRSETCENPGQAEERSRREAPGLWELYDLLESRK